MRSTSITKDVLNSKFSKNYFSLENYIFYTEKEGNDLVNNYIKTHLNRIVTQFRDRGKVFVYVSDLNYHKDIHRLISYCFPNISKLQLSIDEALQSSEIIKYDLNTYLLSYLGHEGEFKNGFISVEESEVILTETSDLMESNIANKIESYIVSFQFLEYDYLPANFDAYYDENIKLNEETKEEVNSILEILDKFKDNGQFLYALPIIEKFIAKSEVKPTTYLSKLYIDESYNIFLSDFNNLQIKLSHLTLSIYHLFLNNPSGILLSDLQNYEYSLMNYYKSISNREDYDKMNQSIQDIINLETGALYVHLSRIKSVFLKHLHPIIAEQYYVMGGKGIEKKILLDRSFVNRNEISNEEPLFDF